MADEKSDEQRARELLDREYGKDHPAARHTFTLSFLTTSHEHRVRELAKEFQAVRAERDAELVRDLAIAEAAKKWFRALEGLRDGSNINAPVVARQDDLEDTIRAGSRRTKPQLPPVETKACPECGGKGYDDSNPGRRVSHMGDSPHSFLGCRSCNGTGKSIPAGGKGAE